MRVSYSNHDRIRFRNAKAERFRVFDVAVARIKSSDLPRTTAETAVFARWQERDGLADIFASADSDDGVHDELAENIMVDLVKFERMKEKLHEVIQDRLERAG